MLPNLIGGNLDIVDIIIHILSSLAVIFVTLPIHEFAHGYVAVKLGDTTPRWQGRLTLNPFAHIDYLGALSVLLFGFGWAKPVSVNMHNFRNPKTDMAITAFAGPLSNIIVAFIFLLSRNIVLVIIKATEILILRYLAVLFYYVAWINIYLAVFNLIPIPPFDGSRLLSAFLPDKYYYRLMQYEKYLIILVFVLVYIGALSKPLSAITNSIFGGITFFANLPFKLIF